MIENRGSHVAAFLRHGLQRSKDRGRSPSPEKVDNFLRKRVKSFRSVPPGPSQFVPIEERYRSQDEIALEDLKKIIDAHDKDPSTKLKANDSSWNTVFAKIATAKQQHEEKSGYRVNEDGVGVVSEALNMIPEELGLGVLKGGLSLILDAVIRHENNRQRILETFETLPDTIITINTAHTLLETDDEDETRRMEFLSVLIKDIPALIKILLGTETWYRKLGGFLLLKIPETSTIDEILSRWTHQITRLKEHVRKLQIQSQAKALVELDRLHGIESSVQSIEKAVNAPEGGILALFSENGPLQQILYETLKKVVREIPEGLPDHIRTTIFSDVATIVREDAKSRQRDKKLENDELEWKQKRLHHDREKFLREREQWLRRREQHITQDGLNFDNKVTTNLRYNSESKLDRAHRQLIKPIQLLGILGVTMDDPWIDFNRALRESGGFEVDSQDWARRLLGMSLFRTWLKEDWSSILLAEGYMSPQHVSPLSGFCCAFISGLVEDHDAVVTFFFAGLHVDEVQPATIMRHLIAQLLLNPNHDLPEPDLGFLSAGMLEDCRREDFYTLCDVFLNLARQVPPDMRLFCVIDGITLYEQEPWLSDFKYLVALLEDLAKSIKPGYSGSLKVLLTTPGWSPSIAELAAKPGSIWVRASLDSGDSGQEMDLEE